MNDSRAIYEFGDFALDVARQRLLRLEGGEAAALTGKTFDLLVYLVEHANEPLDKETLLKAVWPDVVVEENSLTQTISGLRQILGETRGENRYIATLPRKGYRFVARVKQRSETPASVIARPVSRRGRAVWWAVSGIAAMVIAVAWILSGHGSPSRTALAVLPFKPLVVAGHNEALELGMTEALIADLAQGPGRTVRPLSSVRRFGAVDQDAIAAGRELGVDAVLDGLLQREGDRLRVSVRLIQTKDGRQLWARSFEQPFTDIFAVQDAIVAQIGEALNWREPAAVAHEPRRETQDPEAFAAFASGRFVYLRLTEESLAQAIGFFERAVARDPHYARAYAGMADCHVLLAVLGAGSPNVEYPKARAAAQRALQLDPQLAAAHVSLGQIEMVHDHNLAAADHDLTRALELDPNYAPAYFYRGVLETYRADVDRALKAFDRAAQLEPLGLAIRAARALALFHARRYDESIAALRQILSLDEHFDLARSFLIRVLLAKGEYAQVLSEMQGRTLKGPGSYGFVAAALALCGRREDARAELAKVLGLSKRQHVPAYDIATIYAALDDADNTFLWLERAIGDSSPVGTLALEPSFDELHSDPRFASLVARLGS